MVEVAIKAISALKIRDLSKLTLASQMVEFLINLINQGSDRFLYFHHFPLSFPTEWTDFTRRVMAKDL